MEATTHHDRNPDDNVVDEQNLKKPKKWEGKARVHLKSLEPRQVWPLLEDFFGLSKWFPGLSICLPVEGVSGRPGCVRFCAGFETPADQKGRRKSHDRVNWTKQKLLSIDPGEMVFTYSIVDGNAGFEAYVSTVRVGPEEDGGCFIEWRYEVDPVEGWDPNDLDDFIGSGLRVMAARMEATFEAYFHVTQIDHA